MRPHRRRCLGMQLGLQASADRSDPRLAESGVRPQPVSWLG